MERVLQVYNCNCKHLATCSRIETHMHIAHTNKRQFSGAIKKNAIQFQSPFCHHEYVFIRILHLFRFSVLLNFFFLFCHWFSIAVTVSVMILLALRIKINGEFPPFLFILLV